MKDFLACLFLKLICIKDGRIEIRTKEGNANERTHLQIFIKFIKKN